MKYLITFLLSSIVLATPVEEQVDILIQNSSDIISAGYSIKAISSSTKYQVEKIYRGDEIRYKGKKIAVKKHWTSMLNGAESFCAIKAKEDGFALLKKMNEKTSRYEYDVDFEASKLSAEEDMAQFKCIYLKNNNDCLNFKKVSSKEFVKSVVCRGYKIVVTESLDSVR